MTFVLGAGSRKELIGVHPVLVKLVEHAILITTQDFAAHDGLRTSKEQRAHVAAGTSWTMQSRHLRQNDGFGQAVDLVPFIAGQLNWDWDGCFAVAQAMAAAADAAKIELRWGGVWDRPMSSYAAISPRKACAAYVARRKAAKKRAAIDGPHFELVPTAL